MKHVLVHGSSDDRVHVSGAYDEEYVDAAGETLLYFGDAKVRAEYTPEGEWSVGLEEQAEEGIEAKVFDGEDVPGVRDYSEVLVLSSNAHAELHTPTEIPE